MRTSPAYINPEDQTKSLSSLQYHVREDGNAINVKLPCHGTFGNTNVLFGWWKLDTWWSRY